MQQSSLLSWDWGHRRLEIKDCHTILDCTASEISWDIKNNVQHYLLMESLTDADIDAMIGDGYMGPFRQNHRQFVWKLLKSKSKSILSSTATQ